MKHAAIILGLFLAACAPQVSTQPASSDALIPYETKTPSLTSTPYLVTAETPLPTATPSTYTVQTGDTMSHIAERFHVSLDALRLMNPDVSPGSLSVGTVLLIPGESGISGNASTPIPVPVPVTQTVCHPTADRGMWCFALIRNDSQTFIENVSAQITLIDADGAVIASEMALTPLNVIPPETSLPVYVFLPPQVPTNAQVQVQLLSAVSLAPDDARYLPATIHNAAAQIDWDGHAAQVSGRITLPAESKAATKVWVAAVAYDEDGQVVGVRRWEGGEIKPGESINFNFSVASLGSAIDAVEFAVEARP